MTKKGDKDRRSPAASWCFLRDNPKVRLAVKRRVEDRQLSAAQLERTLGIQAYRISRYLRGTKPNLNQYQLVRIANYLDIDLDLFVTFK